MRREGRTYSNAHGKCVGTNSTVRRQPPAYESAAREIVNNAKTQHQMTARLAVPGATHVQMMDKKPGGSGGKYDARKYRLTTGPYPWHETDELDVVNYASERELIGKLRSVTPHWGAHKVAMVHPKGYNHDFQERVRKAQILRETKAGLSALRG